MSSRTLRVATYNIRKSMGTDRRRDPERILRIVRSLRADIVMLQEADRRLPPRPSALPIERIEELTGMTPVRFEGGTSGIGVHGNALFVGHALEIEETFFIDLPGLEPRGAIMARLCLPQGQSLCALGVHLSLLRSSRYKQIRKLLDWIDASDMGDLPVVLAGDFNERSRSSGLEALRERLTLLAPRNSFHARLPRWPLDRIAVSRHFDPGEARVVITGETRLASDHLPLVADLEWKFPTSPQPVAGHADIGIVPR